MLGRQERPLTAVSIACELVDILGEGPMWNVAEQRLYWVDAFAPAIRRLDPATGQVKSFPMPADIGSFVFDRHGTLVGGMRTGFNRIDLRRGTVEPVADPVARDPRLMLNDGKCDRRGRYWCGSVHSDFIGRQAELFRLDPDLTFQRMDGDFTVGNGIAFSPDDRRMYFSDTRSEVVWVYDLDIETGAISNRRQFISTADIEGRVDGATVDREGNYWCALIHGAAIACFSPAGRMIERIPVPAKQPTMVTFGGPDLDVMFVTSATKMLEPDERPAWPDAGKLVRIDGVGARGLPEPLFAG
ncbi:calcium-binding protein [Allostella vacuolata]|nr:calcium-binding protein [Stella vacuolata]